MPEPVQLCVGRRRYNLKTFTELTLTQATYRFSCPHTGNPLGRSSRPLRRARRPQATGQGGRPAETSLSLHVHGDRKYDNACFFFWPSPPLREIGLIDWSRKLFLVGPLLLSALLSHSSHFSQQSVKLRTARHANTFFIHKDCLIEFCGESWTPLPHPTPSVSSSSPRRRRATLSDSHRARTRFQAKVRYLRSRILSYLGL